MQKRKGPTRIKITARIAVFCFQAIYFQRDLKISSEWRFNNNQNNNDNKHLSVENSLTTFLGRGSAASRDPCCFFGGFSLLCTPKFKDQRKEDEGLLYQCWKPKFFTTAVVFFRYLYHFLPWSFEGISLLFLRNSLFSEHVSLRSQGSRGSARIKNLVLCRSSLSFSSKIKGQ